MLPGTIKVKEKIMNTERGFHYGWVILVLAVATVGGALGLARFGYTMILPSMKTGLALSESGAGDLATGNLAGYLVFALACGFFSTRFSPRLIITFFMALVSISMLITGLAPDFSTALAGRILAGIGGGGTNIPVMGVVIAWFAVQKRGFATGITVSGSSFGLFITGLAVPAILKWGGAEGWRHAWFFLAALTMVIAILCGLFLRNTPAEKGLAPYGNNILPPLTVKTTPPSLLESWGLVYKTFEVWHLALIYALFGFSYIIYVTFFVRYLNWEAGFTIQGAGRLWSVVGAVSVASGFLWGSFSDRAGRRFGLAAVFILQFLCYLLFGVWKAMPGYYISALIFSLTAWSIPAIMAAAAGDVLGTRLAPAALGFLTMFFGIGQVLGPFVAGRIADARGSYTTAFIVAAIASLAGGLLSLMLRIRKPAVT